MSIIIRFSLKKGCQASAVPFEECSYFVASNISNTFLIHLFYYPKCIVYLFYASISEYNKTFIALFFRKF